MKTRWKRVLLMCLVSVGALVLATLAGCGKVADVATPGEPALEDETVQTDVDQAPAQADEGKGGEASAPLRARPSTSGALHVEGTQLVGEDGTPVVLFGVSTHGLAWFGQYVNAELFQELSGWGANVMRLALYTDEYGGWCSGGDRAALRQLVLDGVDAATAADQYVIVDWHILSDNNPWTHAEEAKAFLADISAALSDHDNVLYEVCNEPNGATSWDDVRSYAEEAIAVIRANDADAVVIVGTPEWSQRVDQAAAAPLDADNVMYALHFYAATHKDDLCQRMVDAVAAGLPVFVSEFGICDASGNGAIDEASADTWLATMDELGVSRVMWNLSNKDESSAMIWSGCDKVSGFADADLSQAGRWLKARLAGEWETPEVTLAPSGQSGAGAPSAAGATTFRQGALTVSARLENSWPVGEKTCYQYVLAVRNDGDDISSWHIELRFSDEVSVQDGWNASWRADGALVSADNASYNGALAAGQSATDIGVQVVGPSGLALLPQ